MRRSSNRVGPELSRSTPLSNAGRLLACAPFAPGNMRSRRRRRPRAGAATWESFIVTGCSSYSLPGQQHPGFILRCRCHRHCCVILGRTCAWPVSSLGEACLRRRQPLENSFAAGEPFCLRTFGEVSSSEHFKDDVQTLCHLACRCSRLVPAAVELSMVSRLVLS